MIYVLHFNQPYKHARHYVGFSKDVPARLEAHRSGNGARLIEVITQAGIGFEVTAIWQGNRKLERKLHKRGGSRICPRCNPTSHPKRLRKVRKYKGLVHG